MSIFNRLYRAKIAPCSSDWREAIYNGVDVVEDGERWTESFADSAFLAADKPTPVVLSHQDHKVVGQVVARIAHKGWHVVDFTLDHSRPLSAVALDILRVGTPMSIGARSLRHDEILARNGVKRHTLARLDEISILWPNETPAYRGAEIVGIHEYELPTVRHSRTAPVSPELQRDDGYQLKPGESWLHNEPVLIRRYYATPIVVR